ASANHRANQMTPSIGEVVSSGTQSPLKTAAGAKTRVAILGAGPAGLTAGLALARTGNAAVTVFERRDAVGGNAGSFLLDGVWCDHGSHRLHPVAEPRVLDEIKLLLG